MARHNPIVHRPPSRDAELDAVQRRLMSQASQEGLSPTYSIGVLDAMQAVRAMLDPGADGAVWWARPAPD